MLVLSCLVLYVQDTEPMSHIGPAETVLGSVNGVTQCMVAIAFWVGEEPTQERNM